MPRLDTIAVKIRTGGQGWGEVPKYSINGFPLEFDEHSGGTGPGEVFEAAGHPQSFPHSLLLNGPSAGAWEIESLEATYQCANETPYTIRLGKAVLDSKTDLNLWHTRPAKVIDV